LVNAGLLEDGVLSASWEWKQKVYEAILIDFFI